MLKEKCSLTKKRKRSSQLLSQGHGLEVLDRVLGERDDERTYERKRMKPEKRIPSLRDGEEEKEVSLSRDSSKKKERSSHGSTTEGFKKTPSSQTSFDPSNHPPNPFKK